MCIDSPALDSSTVVLCPCFGFISYRCHDASVRTA
jgi:hypothetical protein